MKIISHMWQECQVQTDFQTFGHLDQPSVLFSALTFSHFTFLLSSGRCWRNNNSLNYSSYGLLSSSWHNSHRAPSRWSTWTPSCSVFHCCKHQISQSHVSTSQVKTTCWGPGRRWVHIKLECLNVTSKLAGAWWTSLCLWTLTNSEWCSLSTSLNLWCVWVFYLYIFSELCWVEYYEQKLIKMHHPTSIYGVVFCLGGGA